MLLYTSAAAAQTIPDTRVIFLATLGTVVAVVLFAAGVIWVLLRRLYHQRLEEQKLAAMGVATARILHQLKNPLQTIILHTDLLQDERITSTREARAEVCGGIMGEAQRLASMLTELSAYASGGRRRLALEPLPLHRMLGQVADDTARNGQVEVCRARIDQAVVLGDAYYLRQALDNLVSNACEAMEGQAERRLTLSLEARGSTAVLCVRDTGPGIPQDQLATVFEPFVTGKAKGMGLGLAICREVVDSHGGRIEVRSSPGEGAEFTLLLPLAPEDRAPRPERTTEHMLEV